MADVKICGLQSVEVLKSILHLPIDYIGFVFAPSKRRISPEQAAELGACFQQARNAGHETLPKKAGVFVNPTEQEIADTLKVVPLDLVQLHGEESPAFCKRVRESNNVAVAKAFSIRDTEGTPVGDGELQSRRVHEKLDAYRGVIDILLIDTFDPLYGGGSGRTFRWELIPLYVEWARENGVKLFVAGGLQAENVQSLLAHYAVDGVDVSSGVETDGVKDIEKIQAFVERVKQREQIA